MKLINICIENNNNHLSAKLFALFKIVGTCAIMLVCIFPRNYTNKFVDCRSCTILTKYHLNTNVFFIFNNYVTTAKFSNTTIKTCTYIILRS